MNRVLRACVLWVMAMAMPVQGMAAATMLFCGPGHSGRMQSPVAGAAATPAVAADGQVNGHHGAEPQAADALATDHHATDHRATGQHATGHHASDHHAAFHHQAASHQGQAHGYSDTGPDPAFTAPHLGALDAGDAPQQPPSQHDTSSCSACAACCAALAPPAGVALPPAVGRTRVAQALSVTPVHSFQPDGPDRPPRSLAFA